MSRTSRIPYHQNVYDLLNVIRWEVVPVAVERITAWEAERHHTFPPAMAEFYSTEALIRYEIDGEREWRLPLVDLWSEFSNDERARSLDELFGEGNRPEQLWRVPNGFNPDAHPGPLFRLIDENQGVWILYAEADGSDDPAVFSTDWVGWDHAESSREGWQRIGRFTEMLFGWFAVYYLEDFTPISYQHRSWETKLQREHAPPKPYRNGLWLRTPAEPFQPPVIDYLTEQLDEPERTSRPGNVTTYIFRPPGGIIRVTADEPSLTGGLSAWWIHADTPERLAELARLVLPFGTLRDTLRADTDAAREVLHQIVGR